VKSEIRFFFLADVSETISDIYNATPWPLLNLECPITVLCNF
jgi:hypothetical protein